ncbi:unnamed protein product [Brassica rapa subsp. trilocularis]
MAFTTTTNVLSLRFAPLHFTSALDSHHSTILAILLLSVSPSPTNPPSISPSKPPSPPPPPPHLQQHSLSLNPLLNSPSPTQPNHSPPSRSSPEP